MTTTERDDTPKPVNEAYTEIFGPGFKPGLQIIDGQYAVVNTNGAVVYYSRQEQRAEELEYLINLLRLATDAFERAVLRLATLNYEWTSLLVTSRIRERELAFDGSAADPSTEQSTERYPAMVEEAVLAVSTSAGHLRSLANAVWAALNGVKSDVVRERVMRQQATQIGELATDCELLRLRLEFTQEVRRLIELMSQEDPWWMRRVDLQDRRWRLERLVLLDWVNSRDPDRRSWAEATLEEHRALQGPDHELQINPPAAWEHSRIHQL